MRGRFDLVHAHGLRGALIGVPAARIAGVPALFTAHNLVPPCGRAATATLRFLGRHATVIAVSNAVAATLMARGISRERIHVIPNGVEVADFYAPPADELRRRKTIAEIVENAAWSSADDTAARLRDKRSAGQPLFVVGAIGRLSREKGFDTLISAFSLFNGIAGRDDLQSASLLIVVGAGAEEARLIALARHTPGIALAGGLPDVTALLNAADVIAVPSREEGQGIVALEAMAASKPVVATSVGGLPESILEGDTGLLVPPENPEALAAALGKLADSPELRGRMGASGRERVEQYFTLDAMMEEITGLYAKIASKP